MLHVKWVFLLNLTQLLFGIVDVQYAITEKNERKKPQLLYQFINISNLSISIKTVKYFIKV